MWRLSRRRGRAVILTLLLAAARPEVLAGSSLASAPRAWVARSVGQQELEGRVIDRSGDRLVVDLGALDRVEPGDRVIFRPLGRGPIEGRVEAVSDRSATVALLQSRAEEVAIGTACEVLIPEERLRSGQAGGRDETDPVPSEPPIWNNPQQDWDPERPLLAAEPQRPDEREPIWSGRFYALGRVIREQEFSDTTSTVFRSGVDLRGSNPFGFGGSLRFAMDLDHRAHASAGAPSESDFYARLERLSYAHGGDRFHPFSWEAGRFLQRGVPSFGLIDGAEVSWRLADHHRVGASVGWMPETDAELSTGSDFQIAAHYDYDPLQLGGWRGGLGVQKTWHDGEEDRELMVLRLERPMLRGLDVRATAWVDQYDDADFGKDAGSELTLADVRLSHRQEDSGWSAGLRQWRYPSLLRQQAGEFRETDLFEGETTRFDLRPWIRLRPDLRLSARLDHWQSEDRDGSGGELRIDATEWIGGPGARSSATVYRRTGSFVELTGIRLDQSGESDLGRWRITWDSGNYAARDSGSDDALQHDLRLALDGWTESGWSWSVDLGYRFGDDQDAPSFGFYLQRRF